MMDLLTLSRLGLCALALALAAAAWVRRERVRRLLHEFFTATGHPLNLAVFRIALFWMLLHVANLDQLRWFSRLSEELRIYPWGAKWWLLTRLPINEAWVTAAWIGFQAACAMALIGFRSRTAAGLAAVLGIYVLGVPQCFGKVHHYHHVLWFATLLAASPCGDALSVDALIAAWKRAGRGRVDPPGPSMAYALPVRFVWILMGIIYFFPGFWKWWTAGIEWAWSENLKYYMYAKWAEFNHWVPAWRIDRYPLVYRLAGLGTFVFEMGFLWCMFFPRLRLAMAAGGLAFHKGTEAFMRISFVWLQVCYVTFVDWARGLRWIGRRLFPQVLAIVYDGNCTMCRRTIALVRTADWLERVAYVNALDPEALRAHGLQGLDQQALLTDMHAIEGARRRLGYDAYRALAWRVPLLWPALPVLYLPPVAWLGRAIYRRVADHRSCEIPAAPPARPVVEPRYGWTQARAVTAVGLFLVAGNVFYGARGLSSAWPLACYPTFRFLLVTPKYSSLQIEVVDDAGRRRILDDEALKQRATTGRWKNLLGSVMDTKDEARRRERFRKLWSVWERTDLSLNDVRAVRFSRVVRSTVPEEINAAPMDVELLWEMTGL